MNITMDKAIMKYINNYITNVDNINGLTKIY